MNRLISLIRVLIFKTIFHWQQVLARIRHIFLWVRRMHKGLFLITHMIGIILRFVIPPHSWMIRWLVILTLIIFVRKIKIWWLKVSGLTLWLLFIFSRGEKVLMQSVHLRYMILFVRYMCKIGTMEMLLRCRILIGWQTVWIALMTGIVIWWVPAWNMKY